MATETVKILAGEYPDVGFGASTVKSFSVGQYGCKYGCERKGFKA